MNIVLVVSLLTVFSLLRSADSDQDSMASQDSLKEDRARHVKDVLQIVGGKEKLPAEDVFKDIQTMKGRSVERLLAIMEYGYSRSLGVSCDHCHNTQMWESNEKKEKQIARQMSQMMRTINAELLKNIQGLKSDDPAVNCSTCHRGQVKPALDF